MHHAQGIISASFWHHSLGRFWQQKATEAIKTDLGGSGEHRRFFLLSLSGQRWLHSPAQTLYILFPKNPIYQTSPESVSLQLPLVGRRSAVGQSGKAHMVQQTGALG